MPALKVYGATTSFFGSMLLKRISLPERLAKDAVLVHIRSDVLEVDRKSAPYLEVHASRETHLADVISIADHFVSEIDVEAYDPRNGQFVFHEKDKPFKREDFAE